MISPSSVTIIDVRCAILRYRFVPQSWLTTCRSVFCKYFFQKLHFYYAKNTKETVVIEDSYNGIRAAYEGGFIPIMIPDILEPNPEMQKKAKLILVDLNQLKNYFKTGFLFQIR